MGGNAPGIIRRAARWTLRAELGVRAELVLVAAGRGYRKPVGRADLGRRVAAYTAALRAALLEQGCSAERASALVAESLSRAVERARLPLEVAAWGRHPRNRLARARWRRHEEERIFFRPPLSS